jgi:hypothetical protein
MLDRIGGAECAGGDPQSTCLHRIAKPGFRQQPPLFRQCGKHAVHEAPTSLPGEMGTFIAAILVGLLLGLSGPFGT